MNKNAQAEHERKHRADLHVAALGFFSEHAHQNPSAHGEGEKPERSGLIPKAPLRRPRQIRREKEHGRQTTSVSPRRNIPRLPATMATIVPASKA